MVTFLVPDDVANLPQCWISLDGLMLVTFYKQQKQLVLKHTLSLDSEALLSSSFSQGESNSTLQLLNFETNKMSVQQVNGSGRRFRRKHSQEQRCIERESFVIMG